MNSEKQPKISAHIIVRLSSTRLPKKAIMKIMGKPMIELMVNRVKESNLVNKIVITTSEEPSDDPLVKIAENLNIGCFRGSLLNVMERISLASKHFNSDIIVELLGDNPLVDPKLIDDVISFYLDGNYDYVATASKDYSYLNYFSTKKNLFPLGIRVQVYSIEVAEQYIYFRGNSEELDTKHPCSFIYENPQKFKIGFFEAVGEWASIRKPDINFAVNYKDDFKKMSEIFKKYLPKNNIFSIREIIDNINTNRIKYSSK